MSVSIAGKVAAITGAASGIGLGVATALAQAGVKVMMCDIEQAALDAMIARVLKPQPPGSAAVH